MPVYGMPDLDAKARSVYEGLGFDVKQINCATVYRLGGTIGCLVNVLSRKKGMVQSRDRREAVSHH